MAAGARHFLSEEAAWQATTSSDAAETSAEKALWETMTRGAVEQQMMESFVAGTVEQTAWQAMTKGAAEQAIWSSMTTGANREVSPSYVPTHS